MLYSTELAYYKDSYQTSYHTEIIRVDRHPDNKLDIYLDTTIFYPFGGGQPSDQGRIITETGKAEVKNVQMVNGVVKHEAVLVEGDINDGQEADLEINWDRRFWNMRVHTAGHIVHDVLVGLVKGLTPGRGDHGSKPYIDYTPEIDASVDREKLKEQLQSEVNKVISEDRAVDTRETNIDELKTIAKFIPPNLPKDKPLRIIRIDGFFAMPDGGTQVKRLKEIGKVEIKSINCGQGKTTVKYSVSD
jgi:Ser-tRNA(Ala) deacylase AlaX